MEKDIVIQFVVERGAIELRTEADDNNFVEEELDEIKTTNEGISRKTSLAMKDPNCSLALLGRSTDKVNTTQRNTMQ